MILKLSLALLAGAAASQLSAAPPASGTVSVDVQSEDAPAGLKTAFAEAVGKALTEQGLTVLDGTGHGRFSANVRLSHAEVGTATAQVRGRKGPVAAPGMATGVGANLRLSLPTSKSKVVPLRQIGVEIRIRMRGEESILWQAKALTVRTVDGRTGENEAIASDLATAIFRAYPAQSQDVIGVP